jgi:hypothetical protein
MLTVKEKHKVYFAFLFLAGLFCFKSMGSFCGKPAHADASGGGGGRPAATDENCNHKCCHHSQHHLRPAPIVVTPPQAAAAAEASVSVVAGSGGSLKGSDDGMASSTAVRNSGGQCAPSTAYAEPPSTPGGRSFASTEKTGAMIHAIEASGSGTGRSIFHSVFLLKMRRRLGARMGTRR